MSARTLEIPTGEGSIPTLERADRIVCPLRLHFGDADAITPPELLA